MTKKEKQEELAFWKKALKRYQEKSERWNYMLQNGLCIWADHEWVADNISLCCCSRIKERSREGAGKVALRDRRRWILFRKTERIAFIKKQIRDLKK